MNKKTQHTENSRRHFIRTTAAGLGAAMAAPLVSFSKQVPDLNDSMTEGSPETTATLRIVQTTDVHCQIHPHDELYWENEQAVFRKAGGYAHMATLFRELRNEHPDTFILDTGDMFQGSQLSVSTTGQAYVPILDALNYDLYLPGNWEVIYGKKRMQNLMGSLQAPKICTNMYHDLGEGKRGELIFQPYHIWHTQGIKVGFLGYTDPLVPIRQSPNYSKGILYTKPEENLAHYVQVLREQEQCHAVILIAHLGLSQQIALANMPECQGVDYILGGDTHERVREPIVCKYAKVVEPGAFGSFAGLLELRFEQGKLIADRYELLDIDPEVLRPDKSMQRLLNETEAAYSDSIHEVLGHSTLPLYRYFVVENTIDTMVLQALHWRFPDIDIVLSNGFRFCQPRSTPDETGHIPVTRGFVFDMLPVDSTVRTGKVSGAQLLDWLEKELNNVFAKDASKRFGGWVVKFKGMHVEFEAFAEAGKRVKSVQVKGEPLQNDKLYSILACERDGDPADMLCRIRGVKEAKNTPQTLHKVMFDYLKENSPVTPQPEKNAVILDGPQTLLTQVTGVDYTFR